MYIFTDGKLSIAIHTHIYIYDINIHIYIYIYSIIEGNLEVKLPTIWADEKQRWEESEKRRRKRKNQKKEDPGARKGGKAAKHCVFFNHLRLRRVEK